MKMTRRQFGLTVLGGLAAVLFGRFLGWWGGGHPKVRARPPRARFWRRADHLAG